MSRDGLGMNMDRAREVIGAASVDDARRYALALLDDLAEARRYLVARVKGDPSDPVPIWHTAVAALRRLAEAPAIVGGCTPPGDHSAVLTRAADWLAAIGPDTIKLPCEVCLKPTTISCVRCDRSLCAPHAARDARGPSHDGGRLGCAW